MFTGVLGYLIVPADALPAEVAVSVKPRVVSGMRPTGKLHLGHLVGALDNWVSLQDQYDCFYFVADWHALTSDYADTCRDRRERLRQRGRLDRGRPRPRAEHAVHPVAGARARRALPAAVDGRARSRGSSGCRPTRSSMEQLAGEGPVDARLPRLSAAADGRHHHLRRAATCRSARTRCRTSSCARGRAPLPQLLRRACSSSRSRC